jgi:co-chaperonin GroES (HSP10)|tara:strand:- start:229 stop:504 length:276 start_codon:yes stop_codon:yes gene_type:complete
VTPVNRHIVIDIIEPKNPEIESGIVLPADFKPTEEQYISAKVIGWATDVRFAEELQAGATILINRTMAEKIKLEGADVHFILDNYVIGILS